MGQAMTTTPSGDSRSGPTLSCLTGAIVLREGARAVGSTFARQWDPEDAPRPPEPTPSSLRELPVLPTPSAPSPPALPAPVAPVAATPAQGPPRRRRVSTPIRARSLPWSLVGAFALGAALAALAGERGSLGFAALASAVAGGVTLAAGLAQANANAHARALERMRRARGKPRADVRRRGERSGD